MWGIHGMWVPDGNMFIVGWALFAVFSMFTLYVLNKRWGHSDQMLIFFAAFMMLFAFFMLPTRIHERYLFPVISILALMVPFVKKARLFYGIITATFLTNIAYVLYWLNLYVNAGYNYGPNLSGDPIVIIIGVINVAMFLYGSWLLWTELRGKAVLKTEQLSSSVNQPKEERILSEIQL